MKYLKGVLFLTLILLLTGCDAIGTKKVTCVSEKIGKNPVVVNYQVYKVRNNKIVEFENYDIRTFDSNYLKKHKLDTLIKEYSKETDKKVEKISDTELKVIDTNPTNFFKNSTSNDIANYIVNQMEKKDLNLYSYTCSVK